ncbi:MAG: cell wall anchor protein, partial [Chthonomonadales bacterium]|nr:cell wall anchor protein [Chthonomonadales bacterium]
MHRPTVCVLFAALLALQSARPVQAYESPLVAWGSNGFGELGLGDTTTRLTPTAVGFFADTPIAGACGGGYFSLAVASDGALWALGRNSYGQLGLGDTAARSSPTRISALDTRTTIAIAAGMYHSVALTSDNKVWAWGRNAYGQLGLGDTTNRTSPAEVTAFADKSVVTLAASNTHTLAITSDGRLWAWGANSSGQLGLGYTSAGVSSPTEVTALAGLTVRRVSAGYYHTIAETEDGRLWAWGKNSNGQLGLGDTTDRSTPTPVTAFGGMTITAVSAGCLHTLVNTSDGRLWSFGSNYWGQLGLGDTTDRATPMEVALPGGRSVIAVTAGFAHSIAHASDSTTWAWGSNDSGQLGLGDTADR